MGAVSRSWSLLRSSVALLRDDKSLILFPLLGGLGVLLFAALILGGGLWLVSTHPEIEQLLAQLEQQQEPGADLPWLAYVVGGLLLWLFLLAASFIGNFFLTGLVGSAMQRLQGGRPSVAEGLALARRRSAAIFGYSLIAATLGLLLSMVQSRSNQVGVGSLLAAFGNLAWGVATFLVIPVLAARGVGPIDAIKESASLLRRTWGEQLSLGAGLGLFIGLPLMLFVMATVFAAIWAASSGQPVLAAGIVGVGVTGVALIMLLSATLSAVIRSAVYLYAESGQVPHAFEPELIQHAITPRRAQRSPI